MKDPIQRAAALVAAGSPFVLVTVVSSVGSVPGKPGAKLLLEPDGAIAGTIGGGEVEHAVRQRLDEWLALVAPRLLCFDLGVDLGMTCGGRVELLVEPFQPAPRLVLYGAGHVAIRVAALAREVGFRVAVVDDRAEWASTDNFPGAAEIVVAPLDGSADGVTPDPGDYVVVATRGHAYDLEVAARALARPTRYVGVIGSRRKATLLRERLAERGLPADALARLRSPIGVDIGSETPAEIAVSIVAELIATRRRG